MKKERENPRPPLNVGLLPRVLSSTIRALWTLSTSLSPPKTYALCFMLYEECVQYVAESITKEISFSFPRQKE